MKNYHPIRELFLCRMRTFYREPEAVFWTFGFPVLLTIALGIAFRNRPPAQVFVDVEASAAAERVRSELQKNTLFEVHECAPVECADRLRLGKTSIIVRGGETLEYRYDPTRPESKAARLEVDDFLQRALGRRDAKPVEDVQVTEPGARYIDFLVPGLLGMNLMGGGLWGVGFVVTDMRVRKLLRRLIATPMKKSHFLISLVGGRMAFMFPEMVLLLGAGVFLFSVQIQGNLVAILFVTVVGALSFAGLGLLVACRAQRIETISGLMNLVMLPMWLFSGTFFSYERFPNAFQPFIKALPLTQLNDALRDVILEGGSLSAQGARISILALWGLVPFALALRWFRWT